MNKFYLFLVFCTTFCIGQQTTIHCGAHNIIQHEQSFDKNAYDALPYDTLTPYLINIYFTVFADENGIMNNSEFGQYGVEASLLKCIKLLNIKFNPNNIFFKYTGFKIVSNHSLAIYNYNVGLNGETNVNWSLFSQYKQPNALIFT